MSVEDEIIAKADRILRDTGKYRPASCRTALETSESLDRELAIAESMLRQEKLSYPYRIGFSAEKRRKAITAPYGQTTLDAVVLKVSAAQKLVASAISAFRNSNVPVPDWMGKLLKHLNDAVDLVQLD